jgi:PAS domain S-box-containing protein
MNGGDIPFMSTLGLSLPDAVLAGMVSISADAVIAVDEQLRIVFFNTGAEQIFGYTAAEAQGLDLAELLPHRFRALHRGHVTLFGTSHERARRMGERQEISGLRRNGEEFAAEASIARLEAEGRVLYTAVLRDVSERKRIERDLRAAVRARDDIAGIVSHDLRNPVQAIRMLAGAMLASTDDGLTPAIAEQMSVIQHAAEQMDALIQDLLDAARIDAGQLHVQTRPIDVGRLMASSVDMLEPLASAREQTLELDVEPRLPMVQGDAARLEQVLSNVVGNAIKYTPRGGRITLAARVTDDATVTVEVSDSGPGIPPDQLPHVFDRYWQSARTGRHGAGLGLPIARGIVEAHGGRIWVENRADGGTVVRFTLRSVRR